MHAILHINIADNFIADHPRNDSSGGGGGGATMSSGQADVCTVFWAGDIASVRLDCFGNPSPSSPSRASGLRIPGATSLVVLMVCVLGWVISSQP